MAKTGQSWEAFENNVIKLRWKWIEDEDATVANTTLNLTGKVVKFVLARFAGGEPIVSSPLLSYSSDDGSGVLTVPDPNPTYPGDPDVPHVLVVLPEGDTEGLAPKTTDFYVELEVFEGTDDQPIVVATGTLKLKPNVENS